MMEEIYTSLQREVAGLPWLMRKRLEIFYTHLPKTAENMQKLLSEAKLCTAVADFDSKRRFMFPLQALLAEETAFEELADRSGFSRQTSEFSDICRQLRQLCLYYVKDRRKKLKDSYEDLTQSYFITVDSNILHRRISKRGIERYCRLQNYPYFSAYVN